MEIFNLAALQIEVMDAALHRMKDLGFKCAINLP